MLVRQPVFRFCFRYKRKQIERSRNSIPLYNRWKRKMVITSRQRSCGKAMFSVLSICPQGGFDVTINHNALASLYSPPSPSLFRTWDRTGQGPSANDIWWPSLETCSNLFSSAALFPPPVLTSGGYWSTSCWHKWALRILLECFFVTGRNEVVAKVMFLLMSVILSTGGLPQCMLGYCHPPRRRHLPRGEPPCEGDQPAKEAPPQERGTPPGRRPSKKETPLEGEPPCQGDPPSKPTAKGEIEGDQVQAHTQGGYWGGSDPGPHLRGKLRGIRSRPTPKGEIEGDEIQAHTQGGNWGGSDSGPPPREADSGIRSMSGRYASYWNVFLLSFMFSFSCHGNWVPFCLTLTLEHWMKNDQIFR